MVPSLILLQPDSARSALQYRLDRLAGARSKAQSQGYGGHMWPCESRFVSLSGFLVSSDSSLAAVTR